MDEIYVVRMHDLVYHKDGHVDDCGFSFVGIGPIKATLPLELCYDTLVSRGETAEKFASELVHTVNRLTFHHTNIDNKVALYFHRPSSVPESIFSSNGLLGMSERRIESPLSEEVSEIRKYFALSLLEKLQQNARVAQLRSA